MSLHERRTELVAQMADLSEEAHRLWTMRYINTPKEPQGRSDVDDAIKANERRKSLIEAELTLINRAFRWRDEADYRNPPRPDVVAAVIEDSEVNRQMAQTGSDEPVKRRGRAPRVDS